jgi:hypothetical protein
MPDEQTAVLQDVSFCKGSHGCVSMCTTPAFPGSGSAMAGWLRPCLSPSAVCQLAQEVFDLDVKEPQTVKELVSYDDANWMVVARRGPGSGGRTSGECC